MRTRYINATRGALAAASALSFTPFAMSGGPVHTWNGDAGTPWWQHADNWNTNLVPADTDAVIIGATGPQPSIGLLADTALIRSLFVSGGKALTNETFRIRVSGSPASTRIVQAGTRLVLFPVTGGGNSIDTDTLDLESGGELEMRGGIAQIDDEFRIDGSGSITGHGRVEVGGAQVAAFGAAGGEIIPEGGTLRILMLNDGSVSPPTLAEIIGEGNRLQVDGPMFAPFNDVTMGGGGRLTMRENWSLTGDLQISNGDATVDGDGFGSIPGDVTINNIGTLHLNSPFALPASGEVHVGPIGSLEVNAIWAVNAGHQTSVNTFSTLTLTELAGSITGWNGDIDLNGGSLVVTEQTSFNGEITMDAGIGSSPQISGEGTAWLTGDLTVTADPAIISADFEARNGSSLGIAGGASLEIAGTFTVRSGSSIFGAGEVVIDEAGVLRGDHNTGVGAEVINNGTLSPGSPNGVFPIGSSYLQNEAGTLNIQIAGPALNQADRVNVDLGAGAQLDGTLNVFLTGGYQPPVGSSFTILSAGNVSGVFGDVNGPPGMTVQYFADHVEITFEEAVTCIGDLDGDDVVNLFDLLELLAQWGPCEGCTADLDGDDVVNLFDLLELLSAWGACP